MPNAERMIRKNEKKVVGNAIGRKVRTASNFYIEKTRTAATAAVQLAAVRRRNRYSEIPPKTRHSPRRPPARLPDAAAIKRAKKCVSFSSARWWPRITILARRNQSSAGHALPRDVFPTFFFRFGKRKERDRHLPVNTYGCQTGQDPYKRRHTTPGFRITNCYRVTNKINKHRDLDSAMAASTNLENIE